jgi:ADP-heptose:LPS heptosyltransferase
MKLDTGGAAAKKTSPRSVLLVRLKSFGDILLSTPLAGAIKKAWPDSRVDFLVDERFLGATRFAPGVDREIARPSGAGARLGQILAPRERYDLVIDLHGNPSAALLARRLTRGRLLGYARKRFSFLYDALHDRVDHARHTVEIIMDFLPMLGIGIPAEIAPRLEIPTAIRAESRQRYGPRAVFLQYAARFVHKIWPAERFRMVAEELTRRGYRPHFYFGPGDPVPEALANFPMIRGLPTRDFSAHLSGFDLYLGNETGPMHFAAAAGLKVVALFGPQVPARWGPLTPRARVLAPACACGPGSRPPCRQPEHWCMATISVADVLAAVDELEAVN